uniref:Claspin n=1 Tax=Meloidogyne hapla TaxID=6305 RepID=A0A1I8BFC6_MELHA
MGDKFTNFLKLPEVEQTLLSQQKEMLGTSSDDDEYKDFICDNDSNCSGVKEINIQEKFDMDNKEMLDESFCSHDEDFRVKDSTPPQNIQTSQSLSSNKLSVSSKFKMDANFSQTQPSLDELFAKNASISSDDDDFICVSSPPKSTEVPSFESVFDGTVCEDKVPPNRHSHSSQDEDFRLQNSTPPLCSKEEAKIDNAGNNGSASSKTSYSVDSSCQNECERTDNFRDEGDTSEDSTDSELLENGNLSTNEDINQNNLEVSDEEEFFSQNSSFQENDCNEQKILTNGSLNEKPDSLLEEKNDMDKILSKSTSAEQQTTLTDTISLQDFGNVSDFKQLLTQIPQSLLSKISKASDVKSVGHSSSFICEPTNKYSRDDLLQIRSTKTAEEWKSFLWTNHGTNWPIDEMPFEMDSDLRCSYQKRYSILRERQEAARRFFVSSRPQTDFPTANKRIYQNKKNEQRQGKQKTKKNKKGKNIGDVQLKGMKSGNKENRKLDQKKQDKKVDWTDSEECYESSGSGGLNKKGLTNNEKNININSVPSASKWAMRYLENITSSEDDGEQVKEQKLFLNNQNDKIAKHQLMVGFPFWHENSGHPGWQNSKSVLDFYLNQIKKDII